MTTDVRPLDPADLLPAWTLLEQAFGHTPHPADTDIELALVDPTRFYAVHDDGGPMATAGSFDLTNGYALYAVAPAWTDGRPAGAVEVREIVATDEGARARLWRYLLDLDLSTEVRAWSLAPDDPLLLTHLADPRAARSLLRDGLWVRVLDVPTALAARRYACDVDVVLEVEDRRCPWNTGRWRLSGGRDDAACERTSAAADLVVGPEDLGAAFLGGTPLRSRPVQELTPGALDRASATFGPVGAGPLCPHVF